MRSTQLLPPGPKARLKNSKVMKKGKILTNAAAGFVTLAALVMLLGDMPEAGVLTFVSVKVCGGSLLLAACKVLEGMHPEWEE